MPAARPTLALLALTLMAGCETAWAPDLDPGAAQTVLPPYYAWSFTVNEAPFALGALDIIATEGDRLRTFRLVPCQGGATVCADSQNGRAGSLRRTADHLIVEGLFNGRSFYLTAGGGGEVRYSNGAVVPLAWNNIGLPRAQ